MTEPIRSVFSLTINLLIHIQIIIFQLLSQVQLDFPAEFLTGVSGSYGRNQYGDNIRSLKIHTNIAVYGPFGARNGEGTPFSFRAEDGMITGFHGRAGRYLDAIGLYIAPICSDSEVMMKKKKHSGMRNECLSQKNQVSSAENVS